MKKLYFSIFYFVIFLYSSFGQLEQNLYHLLNNNPDIFNTRVTKKNIINDTDIFNYLDENYPYSTISSLNKINFEGIALELNKKFEINGLIYSNSLSNNKLSLYIMDKDTNGILLEKDYTNIPSFNVGEEITVRGTVNQQFGRISFIIDTIITTGKTKPLYNPIIVNTLDENTESKLIKIEKVQLKDKSQWIQNSTIPFVVTVFNNSKYFDVLITEGSKLSKNPPPFGYFDIVGFGSQNDNTIPYLDNYIIVPRNSDDIIPRKIYTLSNISSLKINDKDGKPLSINENLEISGIISSPNFLTGKKFEVLLTDNEGNGIINYSSISNFNLPILEKKQVTAWGTLKHLSGQTVLAIDTIFVSNPNLIDYLPSIMIQDFSEINEDNLVTWQNTLYLINQNEWVPKSPYFDVNVTDGTNVFKMRIKENTDLFALKNPISSAFKLTGVQAQYCNTIPYNTDYIIQPRYIKDIEFINTTTEFLEKEKLAYPNPFEDVIYLTPFHHECQNIQLVDCEGKELLKINKDSEFIDLSKLPSGTYYIKSNQVAASFTQKIVKY